GCPAYHSVETLLAAGVDAVTIAAPTHLHRELALFCIERGVHVLAEKPIAPSVADGRAIIAAARHARVALMVGHVERFNPTVEALKDAICGEDILSIAITRVGPFPPRMSNVGVVIDLAVHDIDLIRWFTDSEIADVQPQLSNAVAEREDIALLQFRTTSGVLAHINTNWLTPFKARNVTIATRNKYVMGDLLTRQVTECFGFQPDARLGPVSIPFIDLAAQRRRLGRSIDEAIARVLAHCQFILGPEVRALETKLAEFCGARHVVTCASGTDALILVLMAQGIGP